jgi:hypothetical protein
VIPDGSRLPGAVMVTALSPVLGRDGAREPGAATASLPLIIPRDNRVPAGQWRGDTLLLDLEPGEYRLVAARPGALPYTRRLLAR